MPQGNPALKRIQELLRWKQQIRKEKLTGQTIGQILLAEGYSIQEASDAFHDLGYVCAIGQFTLDVQELHVSDNPMEAGLAVLIACSEPRALPSIVWK